ncbi:MAG: hypothetical protein M3443_14265 [Actinomycetota bacterium]|nr:hypothetical protein [Actinomycetota bacterium]
MFTQQLLDTALAQAPAEVKARFALLTADNARDEVGYSLELSSANADQLSVASLNLDSGWRASADSLVFLRRTLHDHYTADNLLGPRVLLPVITAYVEGIERLRHGIGGSMLDELLSIGAGYAEFAGWLCHDSGNLTGAASWCARAFEWAQAAGDRRMAAFVLARRAAQAISTRDGAMAARLASAAQQDRDPTAIPVRAIAAVTEAHGHAISGDAGLSDKALDSAASLIDEIDIISDGDPSKGRYCDLSLYLIISRAKCHLELGHATEAVEAYNLVLDTLPAEYHRDRGQYLAHLVRAYVLIDLRDKACASAEEALAIAAETGSARTAAEVRRILSTVPAHWNKTPEVEHIKDILLALDRTNGGQAGVLARN